MKNRSCADALWVKLVPSRAAVLYQIYNQRRVIVDLIQHGRECCKLLMKRLGV
jgi:hypothetical protein